jgi:hypothetical protein
MIVEIALGIVLGYAIIKAWPELRDMIESLLEWLFNTVSGVFVFLGKCWKWLDNAAWYYKLVVFILVSFALLWFNMVECWGWFMVLYTYFPARWIYNLGQKGK